MTDAQALAIAKAGRRLHDEAREHMRSARYHRRRARELYEQVNELVEACAAHGIAVDFIPTSPNAQGGTSGNRSTSTPD